MDEQGTIDASSSYFPIAFDDYVPGLIKVSTFARVLSLVLPSQEVQIFLLNVWRERVTRFV